jgi:hypothetical protein
MNNDSDGKCYSKNNTILKCENIFQANQCSNGGGIKGLECDMYETCKPKCNTLTTIETCTSDNDNRKNDCYYLLTADGEFSTCVNIVCDLYIFCNVLKKIK